MTAERGFPPLPLRRPPPGRPMFDELRDTTLALQHFYDVEEPHGRDSLGTLHRATEQPFGRPVSVWVLDRLAEMGPTEAVMKRCEDAAVAATRYRGESIVRTLDVGQLSEDLAFVVIEPVTGRSLRQHIALNGPLTVAQTIRVVEQVAAAIHAAHEHGRYRLGVDADRVEVVDGPRAEVRVWGLGLALNRAEILACDTIMTPALARTITPGEFAADAPTIRKTPRLQETEHVRADAHDTQLDEPTDDVDDDADGAEPGVGAEPATLVVADTDAELELRTEGGADADAEPRRNDDPLADALDPAAAGAPDLYALAAIAYECLAGFHPYFRDDRDVGDGVLAILREAPAALDDCHAVDAALASLIHDALGQDTRAVHDTVAAFVAACRAAVDDTVRAEVDDFARPAFLGPPAALAGGARGPSVKAPKARPRLIKALFAVCVALTACCAVLVWASLRTDVTAHASVPEFVPSAADGEGIDVLITAEMATNPTDPFSTTTATMATVYLVSTRGETVEIGETPYILRNQPAEARLRLVLGGEEIQPRQLDLLVRDEGDQILRVSERVFPITAPSRTLAAR